MVAENLPGEFASSAARDEEKEVLLTQQGLRLARAFRQIHNAELREHFVVLAEKMAGEFAILKRAKG